jgi:hypothetical protein
VSDAGAVGLTIQHQLQEFWCWAACSSSTSRFFDGSSSWTQCRIVNSELKRRTCCNNGGTDACNKPWYVDRALTRTGNLATGRQGRATWTTLKGEINAGRPVCARIGWQGGGGHFVLITGYDEAGGRTVEVEDPWTGSARVPLAEFADRYQTTGSWTHTYLTRD